MGELQYIAPTVKEPVGHQSRIGAHAREAGAGFAAAWRSPHPHDVESPSIVAVLQAQLLREHGLDVKTGRCRMS